MIYNRQTKKLIDDKTSISLKFLYNTLLGRLILKLVTNSFFSNLIGIYMRSSLSKLKIKKFIKKNNINMDEYVNAKYKNFDSFFTRKIKEGKRILSNNKDDLISPCDGKLLVYKIDNDLKLNIKNSIYTINELLRNDSLAQHYRDGYCLVYRLCVDDYHHYSYIDDGKVLNNKRIKGIFHTVQPIAFKKYKVFNENNREYELLKTKNFGNIIQMEVGALGVGKIVNRNIDVFKRGEEKGYFRFGGSTIVLLFEKDKIIIDEDILNNSNKYIETIVKMYEIDGRRK